MSMVLTGCRNRTVQEVRGRNTDRTYSKPVNHPEWPLLHRNWCVDSKLYVFCHRCRPLRDHLLWGPVSKIHHQEGHLGTRIHNQWHILQEEAQKAHHCGGKMASHWFNEVWILFSPVDMYRLTWLVFLRCGTATQWRTSLWAKWCYPGWWTTNLTLRSFSCGSEDTRWRMRCPDASAWGSSVLLSWPPFDLSSDPGERAGCFAEMKHLVRLIWRATSSQCPNREMFRLFTSAGCRSLMIFVRGGLTECRFILIQMFNLPDFSDF